MRKPSVIMTAIDTPASIDNARAEIEERIVRIAEEIAEEETTFKHNLTVLMEEKEKLIKELGERT